MASNRIQILDMLSQGKITVEEAERLLSLVDQPAVGEPGKGEPSDARRSPPKYLRVIVEDGEESGGERVNIRVPMALIRAGVKLAALLPSGVTAKVNEKLQETGIGIDLSNLKPEHLEQLVDALADLEVDVQDGQQKVRVFVE